MEDKIELKEKKPRSEKQVESFKRAQEIRKESLKIKREKIKEIKDLKPLEVLNNTKEPDVKEPIKSSIKEEDIKNETTDEEPEIIYVKKSKKKKPKKKIVVEESSSSSSDEEVVHLKKPIRKSLPPIPTYKEIVYKFI